MIVVPGNFSHPTLIGYLELVLWPVVVALFRPGLTTPGFIEIRGP
jgi:hypothetical protein